MGRPASHHRAQQLHACVMSSHGVAVVVRHPMIAASSCYVWDERVRLVCSRNVLPLVSLGSRLRRKVIPPQPEPKTTTRVRGVPPGV